MHLELVTGLEAGRRQPFGELGPGERPLGVDGIVQERKCAILAVAVEPKVAQAFARLAHDRLGEQREQPARVLAGQQMHGAAHAPGPQQRALLGAGTVDVRRRQRSRAGPKRKPCRPGFLRLDRARGAGDVGGVPQAGRPMKPLRGGAQPGEPAHGPPMVRPSSRLTRSSPVTVRCP